MSWDGALRKYVRAAMILKTKHPPLMGLAKIYNSDIFSILQYQAQYWEPPENVYKIEGHVLMSILGFPYNSIVPPLLFSLDILGFPIRFFSIKTTSHASRVRMALKFDPDLQDYLVQCAGAQQCDDRLVCGRSTLPGWMEEGIISDLLKAIPEAEKIAKLPNNLSNPSFAPNKPQKPATMLIHKATHTRQLVLEVFMKRILHWEDEADDGFGTLVGMAELVLGNFDKTCNICIPHLKTAYLKTVCNAWATSTRHGLAPLDCQLGCKNSAKDSLSHYMSCPYIYMAVHKIVPLLPMMCNVHSFLGLYEMDVPDVCCLFLAVDAAHYVYNFMTHAHPDAATWPKVAEHMRQRILYTIAKSPKLCGIVKERVNINPEWGTDPQNVPGLVIERGPEATS